MLSSSLHCLRKSIIGQTCGPELPKRMQLISHQNRRIYAANRLTACSTVKWLCPNCLTTELSEKSLTCDRCGRTFDSNNDFVDLTMSSGLQSSPNLFQMPLGTSLFQTPLVGFLYERGWRQLFNVMGFPGPDKEFDTAMNYLKPVAGDAIMDLSCGSGLFTRRFLSCGLFKEVIAVDYSEAMLTQTQQYVARMETPLRAKLTVIRADVARLPFQTGSFKAIYSGAAIHCWPNPEQAFAEINRVLAPGGVFVFSTFTRFSRQAEKFLNQPLLKVLLLSQNPRFAPVNFWSEKELKGISELMGLEGFETVRNLLYVMGRVNKPYYYSNA